MAGRDAVTIPEGFVLDPPPAQAGIPEGFVLEAPTAEPGANITGIGPPTPPRLQDFFPVSSALQRAAIQAPSTLSRVVTNLPPLRLGAQGLDVLHRIGAFTNTPQAIMESLAQGRGVHPVRSYVDELRGGLPQSTVTDQRMHDAINMAVGMVPFGEGAKVGGQVATQALESATPTLPDFFKPVKTLTGNKQAIAEADAALKESAHQFVKQFRQGGALHEKVLQTLSEASAKAWAPMKELTANIPGTIGIDEVRASASTQLANQPERLGAVNLFLDEMAKAKEYSLPRSGRQFAFTASDWSDLSSELGGFMRKASLQGKQARTFSDLVHTDIRSAIANILEAKASPEMQGNVQLAKAQWADYAADRDKLFHIFAPGASPRLSTETGVNFIKQAATNTLNPSDREFFSRLHQSSGTSLPPEMKKIAESLMRAKNVGAKGKAVAKALRWTTPLLIGEEVLRRH